MFSTQSNASKVALVALTRQLQQKGFHLIDCQVFTSHLASLGARMMSRKDFHHQVLQYTAATKPVPLMLAKTTTPRLVLEWGIEQ